MHGVFGLTNVSIKHGPKCTGTTLYSYAAKGNNQNAKVLRNKTSICLLIHT